MSDDYDIPISINDTIISLSAQIEGLKKNKEIVYSEVVFIAINVINIMIKPVIVSQVELKLEK